MRDRPIPSELVGSLQSLAECQLQSQTSRSAALDAVAGGVMGVDVAIAASVLGVRSALHLWVVALALLCASFATVAVALLMRSGDGMGPMVMEVLANRGSRSVQDLERELLEDLAAQVAVNRRTLDRKEPRIVAALVLNLLAVAVELAGQVH